MTIDEGWSVREVVEWRASGVTVREVTRLRRTVGPAFGRRYTVNAPESVEPP